jgi:hypothetical protein
MTRTRDDFVDCVVYLYESVEDAQNDSPHGGTGFLVAVEPDWPPPTSHADMHIYAVTAKHVIDGGATVVRLNTRAGATDVLPLKAGDWKPHPAGHDLAVAALSLEDTPRYFAYSFFMATEFLERDQMHDADIGIGDDVFMVGRFAPHQGKHRNAPVVRYGNISRMPGEPIPTDETGEVEDGLLVEMRSLSGFSGSPVFWHRDPSQLLPRDKGPTEGRRMRLVLPDIEWLLGVDVSHFPIWRTVQRQIGKRLSPMEGMVVDLNSGQAVVVPAWHLKSLINDREFVVARKERDTKRKEKLDQKQREGELNSRGAVPDSNRRGPEPERLAVDLPMDEAVKKMFEAGKPPKREG